MEILTARGSSGDQGRRRRKASDGHVVAQLLDSPLPTPRRSCCGSAAADTPRRASPQRTHVPFSWESSPGVPKDACGGFLEREAVLPPRPPPGRCGGGATPWHARAAYHGNTTDATSSDDEGGDHDTFSDALDRISSSDRLAAFSARLSSIDGGAGSRRRSPSFIMDRFLPAADAIAITSVEKHPKKSARRSVRRSQNEEEAPGAARRDSKSHSLRRALARAREHSTRDVPDLQQQESMETRQSNEDENMSPRVCGLVMLFPWSVKPVLFGFPRSPRTPRAGVCAAPSPPRRSTTLADVLVKESKLRGGEVPDWYMGTGGSGRELSSPGLGMSILGTSKRYCADARKALSRLARSAADSPRISRERRSGKPATSPLHSTSGRMPQLKPPSESWLSHAHGSNAVNSRR